MRTEERQVTAERPSTEDLIARLAAEPRPAPGPAGALAWAPPAVLVLTGLPLLAVLGVRADLAAALVDPVTTMKWVLPLGVAGLSMALAWRLARPEARAGARPLLYGPVLLLAAGLVASALASLPVSAWAAAMRGSTRLLCFTSILGLSLGPLAATLWALNRGATTVPNLTGFLAGIGSGGLAAALYALYCNEDAAPFFVLWYGLAILAAGGLGALLGPRALRW